jgi:hypothetical protein
LSGRLVKVFNRRTTEGNISMWGTLHLNLEGGRLSGWLCDSWTESVVSAAELLMPRLYWFDQDDKKFHHVRLDIPVAGFGSITLGPIDPDIEPRREKFMRETLAQWENEYFNTQGVQIST